MFPPSAHGVINQVYICFMKVVTRKQSKYAHMRVGMHLDGLAENSQCKISASLEACLRAHERKDSIQNPYQ